MSIVTDNRSPTADFLVFKHEISGAESHDGTIIDTAEFQNGVSFVPLADGLGEGEDYSFVINESDDSGMSGATAVSSDRIIESLSDLNKTADDAEGDFLAAVGIVNTLRFVRITGTSLNVSGTVYVNMRAGDVHEPVLNSEGKDLLLNLVDGEGANILAENDYITVPEA